MQCDTSPLHTCQVSPTPFVLKTEDLGPVLIPVLIHNRICLNNEEHFMSITDTILCTITMLVIGSDRNVKNHEDL